MMIDKNEIYLICKVYPVMGTKFLLGGSQETITDESVLTVIFNFSGDSGTESTNFFFVKKSK